MSLNSSSSFSCQVVACSGNRLPRSLRSSAINRESNSGGTSRRAGPTGGRACPATARRSSRCRRPCRPASAPCSPRGAAPNRCAAAPSAYGSNDRSSASIASLPGSFACAASPTSLILSPAYASTLPDSSIATPSFASAIGTTVALTRRRCSVSFRRVSVVVPFSTAIFLPPMSVTLLIGESDLTRKPPPSTKMRLEKSTLARRAMRLRRVGALEVGLARGDHLQALGHRADHPVHLEVGLADGAADLRDHALAHVDRVAGGLVVGADERERQRIARERDVDRLGGLDLAERVGGRLGEGAACDQRRRQRTDQ